MVQRLRISGRATNYGLGPYPALSLADARAKAREYAQEAAQGRDPRDGGIPTFEAAAESVIELRRPNWRDGGRSEKSGGRRWKNTFSRASERSAFLKITVGDVAGVLEPVWNSKRVTAQRVQNRIAIVLRWAVGRGYCAYNPATDAAAGLPTIGAERKHFEALPHAEVADALSENPASRTPRPRSCWLLNFSP